VLAIALQVNPIECRRAAYCVDTGSIIAAASGSSNAPSSSNLCIWSYHRPCPCSRTCGSNRLVLSPERQCGQS